MMLSRRTLAHVSCALLLSAEMAFASFAARAQVSALLTVQPINGSGSLVGGTVVSNDGFIVCGTQGFACQHTYSAGEEVTLQTMNSTGFSGWLGDCTGTGPCVVSMSAARSVTAVFVASEGYGNPFDLDADSSVDTLTDGVLILRVLQGLSDSPLTAGALAAGAQRTDPSAVRTFALDVAPKFDVDGNGALELANDGVLIVRYLLGFRGDALIADAIGNGARRAQAADIEQYLQSLIP